MGKVRYIVMVVALLLSVRLMAQEDAVFKLIKENGHYYFQTSINGVEGKVIAEGIYADKLTICGYRFKGVSVGVNPFQSLNEYGFIGLKFFTKPTIFDFSLHQLYL